MSYFSILLLLLDRLLNKTINIFTSIIFFYLLLYIYIYIYIYFIYNSLRCSVACHKQLLTMQYPFKGRKVLVGLPSMGGGDTSSALVVLTF